MGEVREDGPAVQLYPDIVSVSIGQLPTMLGLVNVCGSHPMDVRLRYEGRQSCRLGPMKLGSVQVEPVKTTLPGCSAASFLMCRIWCPFPVVDVPKR